MRDLPSTLDEALDIQLGRMIDRSRNIRQGTELLLYRAEMVTAQSVLIVNASKESRADWRKRIGSS